MIDPRWLPVMRRALDLARMAGDNAEVPVGALVINSQGLVIGEGFNKRQNKIDVIDGFGWDADPTAHAEILALRAAGAAVGDWQLNGCTLVVTLEPCTMCAGAAVNARISRIVFGAWDEKAGACGSIRDVVRDSRLNHRIEVIPGVCEAESAELLVEFFKDKRTGNL